jgi:hypothetical protein
MADNAIDIENMGDLMLDKPVQTTNRSPLLHFTGKLVKVGGEYVKSNDGSQYVRSNLEFTDVKVIKTSSPYAFPVAVISISYSEGKNSGWAVLATSVAEIMEQGVKLHTLYGKTLEMAWTGNHIVSRRKEDGAWHEIPIEAWEVLTIEGSRGGKAPYVGDVNGTGPDTNIDLSDIAVTLADGKNLKQFGAVLLTDPSVPDDLKQVSVSSQEESYLATLVAMNKLTKDAQTGIFHKVA